MAPHLVSFKLDMSKTIFPGLALIFLSPIFESPMQFDQSLKILQPNESQNSMFKMAVVTQTGLK